MSLQDISAFCGPWRIERDPHGPSSDGLTNIFVVDATGATVLIVAKHPAWNHMERQRLAIAEEIVRLANQEYEHGTGSGEEHHRGAQRHPQSGGGQDQDDGQASACPA